MYAFLPAVLGLGFLGVNIASAHGLFGGFDSNLTPDELVTRQQTMFQNDAQILGIGVDEVKDAWSQGKTLERIAQEKGISQDQLKTRLQDAQKQKIKSQLQALVDKGVITQAQADKRLQVMTDRINNDNGHVGRGFHKGFASSGDKTK